MDIIRIANVLSEQVHDRPQELFDRYVEAVGSIKFIDFNNYCSVRGINITEDYFYLLLANNNKYLFTESKNGWILTRLDELEETLNQILI
jgi:hypothetical protein